MGKLGTSNVINKELFLKLYKEFKTDVEIAETLGVSKSTVCYFRKNILKLPQSRDTIQLTKDEEEILVGTLLGDSCISYTHSQCRFPKLTFSHSVKQNVYFLKKYALLNKLLSSYLVRQYHNKGIIKGKACNFHPVNYAIGRNLACLKQYRDIFYPAGIKIIPVEFLQHTFTAQSLAYLFMDDGCKNGKTINLNLQGFSNSDLKKFISFLDEKFDIEFLLKGDKTLYLRYKSRNKFYELIIPYITEDNLYKIAHLSHL